jgi:hypothetical protein
LKYCGNRQIYEEIEKQTNACIEIDDLNMLLIKGSDLAVTLAISSLENINDHPKTEAHGDQKKTTNLFSFLKPNKNQYSISSCFKKWHWNLCKTV